jgi:hypothetical protein
MIEKVVRIGRLNDYYGALLTEHQQKCLELHYFQDFSLGEIAAELGVSRQAINDILRRAEDSLENYEVKLKLVAEDEVRITELKKISRLLQESDDDSQAKLRLTEARELLTNILK